MKKFIRFLTFIFFASLLDFYQSNAQTVSWSQIQGPYSGSIQSLTVDRGGDVFATTFVGREEIYRSTDKGGNWQQVFNLLSYGVEPALAVDSSNNIYYGDIEAGLFESTDEGTSWYKNSLSGSASAIAVILGNRLCVGGSQTFSISDDAGKTWSVSQVRTDQGDASSIGEDSLGNIYVGYYGVFKGVSSQLISGGGVYISSDSGRTWESYGIAMRFYSILSIAVEKNGKIFAIAYDNVTTSIYSKTLSDSSWTRDAAGIPLGTNIETLQTNRSAGTIAVTSSGILIYDDATSTWKIVTPAAVPAASITTAFYDPGGMSYAGTAQDGIYFFDQFTPTWVQCGIFPASITSLGMDNSNNLYIGTEDGIYTPGPTDGTWLRASDGLSRGTVYNIYLSTISGRLFASTSEGLFYLLPNELNIWNPTFGQWAYDFVESSTYSYVGTTGGILTSYQGQDWTSLQTIGLPLNDIYSVALDSSNNLFAGTKYDGVFESTDGGSFWTETGISSPLMFCSVKTIEIDHGGRIFAGTDTAGAYYSDDSGINWSSISSISGKNVSCFLLSQGSTYLAGTLDHGVFLSTDRGANWVPVNNGLMDSSVSSLILDQHGYLYAGTDSGLFRGTIATIIQQPTGEPNSFSLSQNYPNPFNPSTVIGYQLSVNSHVTLKVYDVLGRDVRTLVDGVKTPGRYEVKFDGSNLASGVYFYKLTAENKIEIKKMVLIR